MTSTGGPAVMDHALAYAAAGLRVVPLRPDKAGSLLPGRRWKTQATTDPGAIRSWERYWLTPSALIGCVVPDGSIVADVDYPERLNGHRFPDGGAVREGGRGFQYWLADDGSRGGKLPAEAGEIKRAGTLVVLPAPGGKYRWRGDARPWHEQPPAPEWIGVDVRKPYEPGDGATIFLNAEGFTGHDEILATVGRWRWAGLTGADIEAALLRARAEGRMVDGDPTDPWTESDLRAIAASAAAWPPGEARGLALDLAEHAPRGPARSIGTRTAADLRHGPPPDQFAPPFLTADGGTVIYARGGTGKGLTACWLCGRLVEAGHVVMVLDYEGHEREWGSRLRGLGMTDEALRKVHYRAPFGRDWTEPTGALAKVAETIRADCDRLGVTYIIVDSYTVATSNGDTMGGEAAAREYFSGLTIIGRPSLTIAHVRGDSARFPDRPFGSVFVHNLARETWAIERVGVEPDTDPDLIRFGPHIVNLELRNPKANGRRRAPAQFLSFSFYADDTITIATGRPDDRAVVDLIADVLTDGALTVKQIIAAIREDTGEALTDDTVSRTLRRQGGRFEASGTRPRTWTRR